MLVKSFGAVIFGIHQQGESGNLLACLQAAINRTAQQQFAKALTVLVCSASQSPHPKAWHMGSAATFCDQTR